MIVGVEQTFTKRRQTVLCYLLLGYIMHSPHTAGGANARMWVCACAHVSVYVSPIVRVRACVRVRIHVCTLFCSCSIVIQAQVRGYWVKHWGLSGLYWIFSFRVVVVVVVVVVVIVVVVVVVVAFTCRFLTTPDRQTQTYLTSVNILILSADTNSVHQWSFITKSLMKG